MNIQLGEMQSINQEEEAAGLLREEGEKEFWVANTMGSNSILPLSLGARLWRVYRNFWFFFSIPSTRNDLFWSFLVQYMLGVFSVLL